MKKILLKNNEKQKKLWPKGAACLKFQEKSKFNQNHLIKLQLQRGKYSAFFENICKAQNFQNTRFFNFDFFHNF